MPEESTPPVTIAKENTLGKQIIGSADGRAVRKRWAKEVIARGSCAGRDGTCKRQREDPREGSAEDGWRAVGTTATEVVQTAEAGVGMAAQRHSPCGLGIDGCVEGHAMRDDTAGFGQANAGDLEARGPHADLIVLADAGLNAAVRCDLRCCLQKLGDQTAQLLATARQGQEQHGLPRQVQGAETAAIDGDHFDPPVRASCQRWCENGAPGRRGSAASEGEHRRRRLES